MQVYFSMLRYSEPNDCQHEFWEVVQLVHRRVWTSAVEVVAPSGASVEQDAWCLHNAIPWVSFGHPLLPEFSTPALEAVMTGTEDPASEADAIRAHLRSVPREGALWEIGEDNKIAVRIDAKWVGVLRSTSAATAAKVQHIGMYAGKGDLLSPVDAPQVFVDGLSAFHVKLLFYAPWLVIDPAISLTMPQVPAAMERPITWIRSERARWRRLKPTWRSRVARIIVSC